MKIVIYGAGKRGKKEFNILRENGINIDYFVDINAETIEQYEGIPVRKPDDLIESNEDEKVIVSILDKKARDKIISELEKCGKRVIDSSDLLYKKSNDIEKKRQFIIDFHESQMEDYYNNAEKNTEVFWGKETVFYKYFTKMNKQYTVELACGRGRHVPYYIQDVTNLILVDAAQNNIRYCQNRFKDINNITYYVNNGVDLSQIESCSQTCLFTYDSMVHFELLDIFSYLKETKRILVNGGMALFHHSNNSNPLDSFETGEGGRNYMSKGIFAYLVDRAGLKIVSQHVFDYTFKKSDCLTLVMKEEI